MQYAVLACARLLDSVRSVRFVSFGFVSRRAAMLRAVHQGFPVEPPGFGLTWVHDGHR